MSGDIEAAGAAVTAGLAASAIDGGKLAGRDLHGSCANCGATVEGKFCAQCGQPAHLHRTLGHMVEEFLHGLVHFDTRAWRTLPMLVFRPGTLTHDYIHGKRARFISPLAMFLLAVFTMFAVFAFTGGSSIGVGRDVELVSGAGAGVRPGAQASVNTGNGEDLISVDGDIYEQIKAAHARGDIKVDSGWPDLDKKIKAKLENPELALYKVQNAAYKFAFMLVPISLPLLWLLFFWKRGLTLFDHTVFILYSLSFVSLVFIVLSLLSFAPGVVETVSPWLIFAIPVHAYFQMKGGYRLGGFSALWRTPVLMTFAGIGLTIFIAAIVIVGLTG